MDSIVITVALVGLLGLALVVAGCPRPAYEDACRSPWRAHPVPQETPLPDRPPELVVSP
ncbi:hypothetical protein [Nonomuraea sp. LPB2021202275-12-8]|uniref:hypothetical protein n=1 Tax=Nonomuraea sp. LPB2021202275-12-8 TaxID=3120159 RepID=UPI00300C729D